MKSGQFGQAVEQLVAGRNNDPFAILGLHRTPAGRMVRTFQPGAVSAELLGVDDQSFGSMELIHPDGVFEAPMPRGKRSYRIRVVYGDGRALIIDDAYRFHSTLGSLDLYLLGEGSHQDLYDKLGAHLATMSGVKGTVFSVWAPNASRVSVVGDFNLWDGRKHVMRLHPANGIWEIFIPAIGPGERYKFELLDSQGKAGPLKSDPVGQYHEPPPGNASIVYESHYKWQDSRWMAQRGNSVGLDQPISIYEVHMGSWRRGPGGGWLSYEELSRQLVEYVLWMGFTHVELLPVTEHPFDGSWGYQPIGLFAPTQRFGTPDEFRLLVDCLHQAGVAVIADWVPAHFPRDEHGLGYFDGTALYEHADPRKGAHADWGTLIFNYGRREVINYLIGSALYWIREFHIDALRVDAVASMLYLDYSREEGEWLPNDQGGNENFEAVAFLRRLNAAVHREGATCFAEESTAWPGVSRPVEADGLGFTYKWNMGWMNDSLAYLKEQPLHRKHHHDKMTFGLVYAFSENFVLPLSHDEVVHGKGTLLGRVPGDEWQRFASLRAYYGFMFGHPGKKLLFMGGEIAQTSEWNHDRQLDWPLLEFAGHKGVQTLVRSLNHLYRTVPALHEQDCVSEGFEWIDADDREQSIFAWIRRARDGDFVVCVSNFTPVVREGYRLGVPEAGRYRVLLNTDDYVFAGGAAEQTRSWDSDAIEAHGRKNSLHLTLPPLATLILALE